MMQMTQTRFVLTLIVFGMLASALAWPQKPQPRAAQPVKEQLLATLSYSESGSDKILSLWKVPFTAKPNPQQLTEGKPEWKGLTPNAAYVLIDGTPASPFSGNVLWVLKTTELAMSSDLTVASGAIAWHEGQKRAYLVLSRSNSNTEQLQVFQVDPKQPLGSYSVTASPRADAVIDAAPSTQKPFAEWKAEMLSKIGLFQIVQVQAVSEPESLLVQLVDLQAFLYSGKNKPTNYKGYVYLRLNLKDGTFTKAAE